MGGARPDGATGKEGGSLTVVRTRTGADGRRRLLPGEDGGGPTAEALAARALRPRWTDGRRTGDGGTTTGRRTAGWAATGRHGRDPAPTGRIRLGEARRRRWKTATMEDDGRSADGADPAATGGGR